MWEIGDKAVCVEDRPIPGSKNYFCDYLFKGTIYTVRGVEPSKLFPGRVSLFLEEIPLQHSFFEFRFRKVKETKQTDEISLFNTILDGVNNGKPSVPDDNVHEKEKVDEEV